MAAAENGAPEPEGFGVFSGDGGQRLPEVVAGVEAMPCHLSVFVSFHDVDPFFGDFEVLAEGVEEVSGEKTVPSFAD